MAHPISKTKLAERCLRIMNAGKDTVEQKVKIQDCELAVGQARDKVLLDYITLIKETEESLYIPLDWLTERELTPERKGNYFVATLPTRPVSLFNNNLGVYSLHPSSDDTKEIIPVLANFRRMYAKQAAGDLQGSPYYTPFQQELRIYNLKEEDCPLMVMYVQAGEEFTSDEYFCVPLEAQEPIVRMALELMGFQSQAVEDPITDSKG